MRDVLRSKPRHLTADDPAKTPSDDPHRPSRAPGVTLDELRDLVGHRRHVAAVDSLLPPQGAVAESSQIGAQHDRGSIAGEVARQDPHDSAVAAGRPVEHQRRQRGHTAQQTQGFAYRLRARRRERQLGNGVVEHRSIGAHGTVARNHADYSCVASRYAATSVGRVG